MQFNGALLCYGRPDFKSWLEDLPKPAPLLSPTSFPVTSTLSYTNKVKKGRKKKPKIYMYIVELHD